MRAFLPASPRMRHVNVLPWQRFEAEACMFMPCALRVAAPDVRLARLNVKNTLSSIANLDPLSRLHVVYSARCPYCNIGSDLNVLQGREQSHLVARAVIYACVANVHMVKRSTP